MRQAVWNMSGPRDESFLKIARPFKFPTSQTPVLQGHVELELPPITPYLPEGTDADAAHTLVSVYRSHCQLAIDNFRFCKTERFCDSYKSLLGLLTVPGQKLLADPSVAPWVKECDWLKYQKMIPMLDATILTQLPPKAMVHMENVSKQLISWVSKYFQSQKQHLLDAMLEPAYNFVCLLDRFLRVNRAAADAATTLADVNFRDQLWSDWVAHVNPLQVIQNSLLFDHGHKRVLHVLTQEVRTLLTPFEAGEMIEMIDDDRLFEDSGIRSEWQKAEASLASQDETGSHLARLWRFLNSLAARFPSVDAHSLMQYIEVIGNNISRNLTLNMAPSLANFWRVKLFIDETCYWLAEKGGFLETIPSQTASQPEQYQSPYKNTNGNFAFDGMRDDSSHRDPQADTLMEDGNLSNNNCGLDGQQEHELSILDDLSGHRSVTHHSGETIHSRAISTTVDDIMNDDSGIGLGMDDFDGDAKYHSFVGGDHGSDPADVVVC